MSCMSQPVMNPQFSKSNLKEAVAPELHRLFFVLFQNWKLDLYYFVYSSATSVKYIQGEHCSES